MKNIILPILILASANIYAQSRGAEYMYLFQNQQIKKHQETQADRKLVFSSLSDVAQEQIKALTKESDSQLSSLEKEYKQLSSDVSKQINSLRKEIKKANDTEVKTLTSKFIDLKAQQNNLPNELESKKLTIKTEYKNKIESIIKKDLNS